MTARLATTLWVNALQRRADRDGAFLTVVARGDPVAGAVVLLWRTPAGETAALARGGAGWATAVEPETDSRRADAYAARQRDYDPDLWIVELITPDIAPFIVD